MSTEKWPSNLTIVRHGQSARNVEKERANAQGKAHSFADMVRDPDTPLTRTGELQAISAGVSLRRPEPLVESITFDVLYHSPYLRTKQTAEKIIKGLGYEPRKMIFDDRLREIEFGIFDGLTREGMEAKYPEEIRRRQKEGKYWYRPPGGESRPDVGLRLQSFLSTLTRDYTGKRVLVVTHSVVVLMFRRLLERWDEDEYMKVDKENDVKNCSITTYLTNPVLNKLELWRYNEVPYSEI